MRIFRSAVVGAVLSAVVVAACGPGGGSPTPSSTPGASPTTASPSAAATPSTAPSGEATIASTFSFGGPSECPNRPFCLLGLQDVYGLQFKEFKPLDSGGPITVEALANNEVQLALMFSTDPTIAARNFVVLEDDKQLQRADNLVPVVRQELLDENAQVAGLLDGISAKLTQEQLIELNRQFTVEHKDPRDIAADWLELQGFVTPAASPSPANVQVVVGKTNFYEQDILSELYAQILEANGFSVSRQDASGSREVVFPAVERGDIDILPEYAASALEHVNAGAGEATADPETTVAKLRERLAPKGLTALDAAQAASVNVFVVTQATATQFGLVTISDLAKPAP